jgi:N-acetylneuraminate synthase/N,N'-diacetyllegionaminate synthase
MLKYAAQKDKPILLSTGMSDLADIQNAVNAVYSTGNRRLALLHCVAVYPCPPLETNLRMMDTIRDAFLLPTGFSDHSLGISIPIAAVARGAKILEKHFTLDRNQEGPDHPFALEPNELEQMVESIREVEESLGSPIKQATPSEIEKVKLSRRSIIAVKHISEGDVIEKDMLIVKRPGFGISPNLMDIVVGRRAKKDIEKESWITWDMI